MDKHMAQPDESDIQALIKRIQQGESDLFGQIFDIFADRIFRFVYLKIGDRENAKDLASETFLGAFQSVNRYKPQSNTKFSTWLFSIAHKKIVNYYRWQKNRKTISLEKISANLVDKSESNLDKINKEQQHQLIIEYLHKLPENLQEILILKFIEELDYSEIQQITGKKQGNIRVLLHRGIKKLREELQKDGYEF